MEENVVTNYLNYIREIFLIKTIDIILLSAYKLIIICYKAN